MARYFKNAETLEQLRKQYKDLLKKHHPDNGGNLTDMQEINAEYDRLFKVLKDMKRQYFFFLTSTETGFR